MNTEKEDRRSLCEPNRKWIDGSMEGRSAHGSMDIMSFGGISPPALISPRAETSFRANPGPTWSQPGATWSQVETKLGQERMSQHILELQAVLGHLLGPTGGQLGSPAGPTWSQLGPSWNQPWPTWKQLEAILGQQRVSQHSL